MYYRKVGIVRSSAIISSKGQVVIPVNLRKKYGLEEGTTVIFHEREGQLTLEPGNLESFLALAGTLKGYRLEEALEAERAAERLRENKR